VKKPAKVGSGADGADIRAFIAIELPEDVKVFLREISNRLSSSGGDVSWTRSEGMHLTLKFLGNISPRLVTDLGNGLGSIFAAQPPFRLRMEGIGTFPDLRRPRVIWAGLKDPQGALEPLAAKVEDVTASLGLARENRRYNPHLTLGRVRSSEGCSRLMHLITDLRDLQGPSFVADRAALFQSILKPTGAQYTALIRFATSSA
jgi:RNA 2',3'-cyclic 3'-phosphodiesterase